MQINLIWVYHPDLKCYALMCGQQELGRIRFNIDWTERVWVRTLLSDDCDWDDNLPAAAAILEYDMERLFENCFDDAKVTIDRTALPFQRENHAT